MDQPASQPMPKPMFQPMPQPVSQPVEPTGIAAVDEVLEKLSSVADLPVAEHAAVFERAHEQLRRALDAQLEAAPDDGRGA